MLCMSLSACHTWLFLTLPPPVAAIKFGKPALCSCCVPPDKPLLQVNACSCCHATLFMLVVMPAGSI